MAKDDRDNDDNLHLPPQTQTGMGRRDFFKSMGLITGGLAISPSLLAACANNSKSYSNGILHIVNWPTYIGEGQVKDFERATGIKTKYSEDINDNSEYFAQIQPQLNRNESIDTDGFMLTDWMANRLINQLKWVQKLDESKFTNKPKMIDTLKSPSYDKDRTYSAPWASVIAGIAYNINSTGKEIRTFDEFLDVKGTKTVLSEMRDTIGIMMMDAGDKIETAPYSKVTKQFDRLKGYLSSGKITRVQGNDYMADLASGSIAACIAWSGDVTQLMIDNPDVRFIVPESGGTISSDIFMVPKTSNKVSEATEFINFFYDPAVSAKWVTEVQFISPVKGVQDELVKLGGESAKLAENPLVVPDDEMLKKLQIFGALSEKDEEDFDKRSAEIVGAG